VANLSCSADWTLMSRGKEVCLVTGETGLAMAVVATDKK